MEANNHNTPVIYEVDIILGSVEPPNGHIILRYEDGRNYMGTVKNGIPNGFGISIGYYWIYEGQWFEGIMIRGVMRHIYTNKKFVIPSEHISPVKSKEMQRS